MLSTFALGVALHLASDVGPISLADLAVLADAIVIGRVSHVVNVTPQGIHECERDAHGAIRRRSVSWTVAEVALDRVIKGNPFAERLWYFADGTWPCDTTTAVVDEPVLLFLVQSDPLQGTSAEVKQVVAKLTGGQPVLADAYAGRGRFPVLQREEEWVTGSPDVVPPEDPAVRRNLFGTYWPVPLADMLRWIEASLSERAMVMPAHPVSGLPAAAVVVTNEERIVAALWKDGTVVWSVEDESGGPHYKQGQARLRQLERLYHWCGTSETGLDPSETAANHRFELRLRLYGRIGVFSSTGSADTVRQLLLDCIPAEGSLAELDELVMR